MGAKISKGAKSIIFVAFVFFISVAIVTTLTFSLLNDSKSASGTITFDLADYSLNVDLGSASAEKIAPGVTANANTVKLKNTYSGTGATAGLGGVFVKLTLSSITIGTTTYTVSSLTETTDTIQVVATNGSLSSSSVVTVEFVKSAGSVGGIAGSATTGSAIETFWRKSGNNALVLSSTKTGTASYARLAFTDKNQTAKTIDVNVKMTGLTPSNGTNGFNNTDTVTNVGTSSKYAGGVNVTVNYSASWQTTSW